MGVATGVKSTKCLVRSFNHTTCNIKNRLIKSCTVNHSLRIYVYCILFQNVATLSLISVSIFFWAIYMVGAYFGLDVENGFKQPPECFATCETEESNSDEVRKST